MVIVKALRNLGRGEDGDLAAAYAHFHKMVDQHEAVVNNAILGAMNELQQNSKKVHADIRTIVDASGRTEFSVSSLAAKMDAISRSFNNEATHMEQAEVFSGLSTLTFDRKQRAVLASHHQDTCSWLLWTDEFKEWLSGQRASVLWCPGIPGAGKTVMTSFLVNYTQTALQGPENAVVYIYCNYKDPQTHSELELLACIGKQLAEQAYSGFHIARDFARQVSAQKRDPLGDELVAFIKSLCALFRTVHILIDALDECPEVPRDKFLSHIRNVQGSLRLFITSRLPLNLEAWFTTLARVEIQADANDLRTYLEQRIDQDSRMIDFARRDGSLKQDVMSAIVQKAGGMFLLARFQMDYLRRQSSPKAVRNAMQTLPKELSDYYTETLQRIEQQDEEDWILARTALTYIFCAKRALKLVELCEIIAMKAEDTDVDESAIPGKSVLLNASAGLIDVDNDSEVVRLAHQTLQEYLANHRHILLPDADPIFAQVCLRYLSLDCFGNGPCPDTRSLVVRLQRYSFSNYASHNWGLHVAANQACEEVFDLLLAFLRRQTKLSSSLHILYYTAYTDDNAHSRFPKDFGPMHAAAYWGLEKIISVLFDQDTNVDAQDSYGDNAPQLAARRGHELIVQFLLEKGADVNLCNGKGETALYWAARNEYRKIMEILIAKSAKVLIKDNEGWSALDWAVLAEDDSMVQVLLADGIDIRSTKGGKQKALNLAAEAGRELTVQMLVDSGADVDARDSQGSTALDWAVPSGQVEVVRALLKAGADVNSKDVFGNTVLHWATQHKLLMELLLCYPVQIDAKNNLGQTALCWAAQDGPLSVLEVLLEHDADINAVDVYGFTPLHRASLRGREHAVELLLQGGANPNSCDEHHWTPLHVALIKRHKSTGLCLSRETQNSENIISWAECLRDDRKQALLEDAVERRAGASTVLTGLRAAIQERQYSRSKLLLEEGADINETEIGGWTALIIAAVADDEIAVQLLLDNGADVDVQGHDQRSALHWAGERGHVAVVQLLLARQVDVNARAFTWTAGLLAARRGKMSVVALLMANGIDINAEDYYGRSILHWTIMHDDLHILQDLLRMGANPDAKDRYGRTALMWAIEYNRAQALETLLEHGADVQATTIHGITALHLAAFIGCETMIRELQAKVADSETKTHYAKSDEDREQELESTGKRFESLCQFLERQSVQKDENEFSVRQLALARLWNSPNNSAIPCGR